MKLEFDRMEETILPQFNGGEKEFAARMLIDEHNRILRGRLVPGASIGLHTHETSSEIVYVLSGTGTMLCDGGAEELAPGDCHYCPKGHCHSFVNTGTEDLVFFAVVPQQ